MNPFLTTRQLQAFQRRLLAWYATHERDLPWRKNALPYRVWVSEVMLQQTQVATAGPYFKRFMRELPTVQKLAKADEKQVLRLWEGLGYYRRARQLHAAAQQIVAEHGGKLPVDVIQLQTLPGIGRYTAGAICSIAFDQRVPILEANTIRLFARLIGYRESPTKAAGQRILWQTAEDILPKKDIAKFNQALMELGSLVCKPEKPLCDKCPVNTYCQAAKQNAISEIPFSKPKQVFTDLLEAAVVVCRVRSNKPAVLLRQCGEQERWAGLWDFPRFELETESVVRQQSELAKKTSELTGVSCQIGSHLKTIRHGVTRYRIRLDCFAAEYTSGRLRSSRKQPAAWVNIEDLEEYPLSTTGRKLAKLVPTLF